MSLEAAAVAAAIVMFIAAEAAHEPQPEAAEALSEEALVDELQSVQKNNCNESGLELFELFLTPPVLFGVAFLASFGKY